MKLRGLSLRTLLAELEARDLPRVSSSSLHRIISGEQRTARASVRDGIAAVLGAPFTAKLLSSELAEELELQSMLESEALTEPERLNSLLTATGLVVHLLGVGPFASAEDASFAAGLMDDDAKHLLSLRFWLQLLYGPEVAAPSELAQRDFAGSMLLALDVLWEPMRQRPPLAPDPAVLRAVEGWVRSMILRTTGDGSRAVPVRRAAKRGRRSDPAQ